MPTLEELFKTKKLISGKTAEQQYDIRNSKSTPISSASGLMTLPIQGINKIRQKSSTATKETFLEQELTGVRVLSKLASPILYGTKIARFTLQQSDDVQEMKTTTNPDGGGGGLLGGIVNAGRSAINSVKSFLGVPQNITPSKIYLNTTQFNGTTIGSHLTMRQLAKIKKDGAGSLIGKFLSQNVSGTPGQMANSLPSAAADAGKKALKNILLGSGNEGQINLAKMQTGYNDIYAMGIPLDEFYLFSSQRLQSSSVRQYKYSRTKKRWSDDINERNDLSSRYNQIIDDGRLPEKTYSLSRYASDAYTADRDFYKKSLTTKRGLTNNWTDDNGTAQKTGNYLDKLNSYSAYLGETKKIDGTETTLDDLDLIPLKFYSVAKNASVNFRATVTGLTETFAPTWDSSKMIGNPFQFWTYSQIDRTLQFNFKVYSLSAKEHIAAWQRLSFLTSLVYPQTYGNTANDLSAIENYVVPPFLKFTLGDMYKGKECFIQSLIYTIDDNNMWDVGAGALTIDDSNDASTVKLDEKITKDYKLPTIIDVGVTLQFVETKGTTYRNRMYGFGGAARNVQTAEEKALQLYPDGTPINVEQIAAAKKAAEEEKQKNAEAAKKAKEKEAAGKALVDKLLRIDLTSNLNRKDPNYNILTGKSMKPIKGINYLLEKR
jgi:hypothetical protein